MHSRIYQITTSPVGEKDYITDADFYEHWFVGSIADYVDDDVDRDRDIEWLRDSLKIAALFLSNDSFVIQPNGKEAYFKKAYKTFVAARDMTLKMGLAEFASNEFAEPMSQMEYAFRNEFGFYVSSDEFGTITLDEFIRGAETGKTYYIGGTLDYHF